VLIAILLLTVLYTTPNAATPEKTAVGCINRHTQDFVSSVPMYEVLYKMNAAMCRREIMSVEGFTTPAQALNFSIGATGQSLLWLLRYELQMNEKEIEEAERKNRMNKS
jgi:hypothetical protein